MQMLQGQIHLTLSQMLTAPARILILPSCLYMMLAKMYPTPPAPVPSPSDYLPMEAYKWPHGSCSLWTDNKRIIFSLNRKWDTELPGSWRKGTFDELHVEYCSSIVDLDSSSCPCFPSHRLFIHTHALPDIISLVSCWCQAPSKPFLGHPCDAVG